MRVDNYLKRNNRALSLEIVPPDRGSSLLYLFRHLELLMHYEPDFINVTNHQPFTAFEEHGNSIIKVQQNKKPGTVAVCTALRGEFNVETIPHLICGGTSRFETEDKLIELKYLGFENIFAVRGDPAAGQRRFHPAKDGHKYASALVNQIDGLNRGIYSAGNTTGDKAHFCVGVAAYPEKHYESLNMNEDIRHLKAKVQAGAKYIITQMLFNCDTYVDYVNRLRRHGINLPVIPGIKPVTSIRSLKRLPGIFHINIPGELVKLMEEARTPEEENERAIAYTAQLVEDLYECGAPGVHIFTMGKGTQTARLLDAVHAGERR